MNRYSKLFEVKIFHAFYEQHGVRDLNFLLIPATRNHMVGLQLIYKETPEGFIVLYNEEKKYLLENLKEDCFFKIGVYTTNRYFMNFSDLPARTPNEKHFLSNKESNAPLEERENAASKKIQLHPNSFLDPSTIGVCCTSVTTLQHVLGSDEITISKEDHLYFEGSLEQSDRASNLLSGGYGIYEVKYKETDIVKNLHFVSEILDPSFAVLDISVGLNNPFDQIKGSTYYVRIGSREVAWNYYFVSRKKEEFESIKVVSGKSELPYTAPAKVTLSNGQEALKMQSEETYSLKRSSHLPIAAEFVLPSKEEHEIAVKRRINLPKPDITRIKARRNGDKEIYFSDMYVYL